MILSRIPRVGMQLSGTALTQHGQDLGLIPSTAKKCIVTYTLIIHITYVIIYIHIHITHTHRENTNKLIWLIINDAAI
jgi:hypothetical protein